MKNNFTHVVLWALSFLTNFRIWGDVGLAAGCEGRQHHPVLVLDGDLLLLLYGKNLRIESVTGFI